MGRPGGPWCLQGQMEIFPFLNNCSCSVSKSCPALCDHMDCSTPGFAVHHQLLELAQTHVHWVGDAIQPSYPLSSPFPPAFNQGLFQWVGSSHQVAKLLELQLQHQSFQWIDSVQFSRSVMFDSLWPHGLQHARLPYPPPTPRAYSNSYPLSRWCHPTISSSIVPFSSFL